MSARRFRPEGVVPLEVWDVLVAETPLYLLSDAEQPQAIAEVVVQLCAGRARRKREGAELPRLAVDEVVLAGGRDLTPTARALEQRGLAVRIAQDPGWIAEAGGRALLAHFGFARGAVLDVGQTALKYSGPAGRTRTQRPFERVPLEQDARDPALAAGYRAAALAFIASALRAAPPPEALVLALPCEIEDDLRAAGCSYPWPAQDPTLVADLLRSAGLEHVPCWVLNDAELAAVGVDRTRDRSRRALVLTLGLGLGAAWLDARR